MADLHTWITQQVDLVTATAQEAANGAGDANWQAAETANCECCVNLRTKDGGPLCTSDSRYADHMAAHDPAAVLRRCEADRRILARHDVDPALASDTDGATACAGCEQGGDRMDTWWHTENLNDCPELLDLAHAHGITDQILTTLDRPQPPEPKATSRRIGHWLTAPTQTRGVPAALRGPAWKGQP